MFKGFYNLTSSMITQQQNLNIVGNNLVNVSTAGYKENRYTASTFDEVMYSRAGNEKKDYVQIGQQSYIRAPSEVTINYDQGIPEPTNIPLDFAIEGTGFFAVQRDDGEIVYTRAGSFSLDNEGYLCFPTQGRVMDIENQPIQLMTDKIEADNQGRIYTEDGQYLGQVGVYDFADYEQLERNDQGMFTGNGAERVENPLVHWKYLERSNTDMVRQMTEMLTAQRALQSAAQVTRMYDTMMGRAASDVGRLQ